MKMGLSCHEDDYTESNHMALVRQQTATGFRPGVLVREQDASNDNFNSLSARPALTFENLVAWFSKLFLLCCSVYFNEILMMCQRYEL